MERVRIGVPGMLFFSLAHRPGCGFSDVSVVVGIVPGQWGRNLWVLSLLASCLCYLVCLPALEERVSWTVRKRNDGTGMPSDGLNKEPRTRGNLSDRRSFFDGARGGFSRNGYRASASASASSSEALLDWTIRHPGFHDLGTPYGVFRITEG